MEVMTKTGQWDVDTQKDFYPICCLKVVTYNIKNVETVCMKSFESIIQRQFVRVSVTVLDKVQINTSLNCLPWLLAMVKGLIQPRLWLLISLSMPEIVLHGATFFWQYQK